MALPPFPGEAAVGTAANVCSKYDWLVGKKGGGALKRDRITRISAARRRCGIQPSDIWANNYRQTQFSTKLDVKEARSERGS